jgi:preprotein translocase subunit SecG
MDTIFSVVQVGLAIGLILLILMHSGKDAGLSGAFGVGTGAGRLGGGSLVERNLNRWTVAFAVVFAANTILLLKAPWSSSASTSGTTNAPLVTTTSTSAPTSSKTSTSPSQSSAKVTTKTAHGTKTTVVPINKNGSSGSALSLPLGSLGGTSSKSNKSKP